MGMWKLAEHHLTMQVLSQLLFLSKLRVPSGLPEAPSRSSCCGSHTNEAHQQRTSTERLKAPFFTEAASRILP
jgi:hypothetical protein